MSDATVAANLFAGFRDVGNHYVFRTHSPHAPFGVTLMVCAASIPSAWLKFRLPEKPSTGHGEIV
jgi:hypothetical protein